MINSGMTNSSIWITIFSLGILTLILRSSFIVFLGDREMPPRIRRYLRYVAVAIIPGMIAQQIAFPASLGGSADIIWIIAAIAALITGLRTQNALTIMIVGAVSFMALMGMRSYGILF